MDRSSIRKEIRRRADHHLSQKRLTVDYYRIRMKVSYPLPVRAFRELDIPLRVDFPVLEYPWALWLSWALEERITVLGWAAEWLDDSRARAACERDLTALCEWPSWRQWDKPELSLGHCARLVATAYLRWTWVSAKLRQRMRATFARMLAVDLPYIDSHFGELKTKEQFLALPDPNPMMHNMPLIGMAGMSMIARILRHPAQERIDRQMFAVYGALLDLCKTGFTEAVSYDGYVLDFVTSWLQSLPADQREPITRHPRIGQFFEESLFLGAPGNAMEVAELSDVEPVQMPFHATANARSLRLWKDDRIAWWLSRCDMTRLPTLALVEIADQRLKPGKRAPPAGAMDAHYALVLRSGWEARDLAVAMSATTCTMGHIHKDNGSLVIGTAGRWLLADPGYQQYLLTSEREFTLSSSAHNAPVIDGSAQSVQAGKRISCSSKRGLPRAELDMTACYPKELRLSRVTRTIWLAGRDLVVVADRIEGATKHIRYHWHGHPDAAWWWEDGAALIALDDSLLRIRTPAKQIDEHTTQRLRGSRGHLTVNVELPPNLGVYWWVFSLGDRADKITADGKSLRVGSRKFTIGE
jgi:hypothetical protein